MFADNKVVLFQIKDKNRYICIKRIHSVAITRRHQNIHRRNEKNMASLPRLSIVPNAPLTNLRNAMTNGRQRLMVNNFLSEQFPGASQNVLIWFPTFTYSVTFKFSFIPTTNILTIAGCLGFVVKLHRFSSFYEQSFLALFISSREGTQAETMLQPLRRSLRTSAMLFKEADSRTLKRGCLIDKY